MPRQNPEIDCNEVFTKTNRRTVLRRAGSGIGGTVIVGGFAGTAAGNDCGKHADVDIHITENNGVRCEYEIFTSGSFRCCAHDNLESSDHQKGDYGEKIAGVVKGGTDSWRMMGGEIEGIKIDDTDAGGDAHVTFDFDKLESWQSGDWNHAGMLVSTEYSRTSYYYIEMNKDCDLGKDTESYDDDHGDACSGKVYKSDDDDWLEGWGRIIQLRFSPHNNIVYLNKNNECPK